MPVETSSSNLPAKVGDKIKLNIRGPAELGHGVFVGLGGQLTLDGTIIGDLTTALYAGWLIELTTSINGVCQAYVPKHCQRWKVVA